MKCKKKQMEVEISRELRSANPEKWMDGQKWVKQFKISSSTRHHPQTQPDTGPEFANCSQIYQILNHIEERAHEPDWESAHRSRRLSFHSAEPRPF